VVWNNDMSAVALLSKHAIIIADKRLGGAQVRAARRVRGGPRSACLFSALRGEHWE
jgi:hypothetical protein